MKPEVAELGGEAWLDVKVKQGHAPFSVEMKITDDAGRRMPWDGRTYGRLKVRGPTIAARLLSQRRGCARRRGLFRYR